MTQPSTPAASDSRDPAEAADARYQIGAVAERTGVTQRTLRFYEEKGLLQPSERMQGGFRLYSDEDIERIEQIKRLQDLLGLSLAEIKEMVEAEELLHRIRSTTRPDRDLVERKERVAQVRGALRLQHQIIERKTLQLDEMKASIEERLALVDEREREINEAMAKAAPGAT